ncbi:hypothetical protein [Clostridium beijerinckii]|uniref:hypothetical protein n=1 Tax=Clostridium beijerinckii TaxID=1520 RepID=UPI002430E55C|nr:hypothetical protein [Clostridium beijerinckii]MDG5857078.1 hypothetical protein [Clostridium beijerinckii]
MVNFKKCYFEEGKIINEGTVNNKNYKIYVDEHGSAVDISGNLTIEDLYEINNDLFDPGTNL